MAENVTININAKDNASAQIKRVNISLKDMGEVAQKAGPIMTGLFTAPVVGAVGGLAALAFQTEQVKAALMPIQTAFSQIGQTLAPHVASMIQELTPALLELAGAIGEAAIAVMPLIKQALPGIIDLINQITALTKGFTALDPVLQQAILGFVAATAAVGPFLMAAAPVIELVVTLTGLFPGMTAALSSFGASAAAVASGPVGWLVAAIAGLIALIMSPAGQAAFTTLKQIAAMAAGGWVGLFQGQQAGIQTTVNLSKQWGLIGKAGGGMVAARTPYIVGERGPELFMPGSSGTIIPNHQLAGAGGINITYAPAIGAATNEDLERIGYLVEQALRRRR